MRQDRDEVVMPAPRPLSLRGAEAGRGGCDRRHPVRDRFVPTGLRRGGRPHRRGRCLLRRLPGPLAGRRRTGRGGSLGDRSRVPSRGHSRRPTAHAAGAPWAGTSAGRDSGVPRAPLRDDAHAPYSNLRVGAAGITDDGQMRHRLQRRERLVRAHSLRRVRLGLGASGRRGAAAGRRQRRRRRRSSRWRRAAGAGRSCWTTAARASRSTAAPGTTPVRLGDLLPGPFDAANWHRGPGR